MECVVSYWCCLQYCTYDMHWQCFKDVIEFFSEKTLIYPIICCKVQFITCDVSFTFTHVFEGEQNILKINAATTKLYIETCTLYIILD